jgi:hypothetical protein
MPLVPTPARLKFLHAGDQWYSSRAFPPLTGWHCQLRPNTEGMHVIRAAASTAARTSIGADFVLARMMGTHAIHAATSPVPITSTGAAIARVFLMDILAMFAKTSPATLTSSGAVRVRCAFLTMDSVVLGLAASGCDCCTVRVFRQIFPLEDAIRSHACSLEASRRVPNGIPLGSPLLLPFHHKLCRNAEGSGTTNGYNCDTCKDITCGENQYRSGVCSGTYDGYTCNTCSHITCADNQYRTGTCSGTTNNFKCVNQPVCDAGEYISGDSSTSVRTCTACGVNTYQSATNHRETSCIAQTQCGQGHFIGSDSKTAARLCKICPDHTYLADPSRRVATAGCHKITEEDACTNAIDARKNLLYGTHGSVWDNPCVWSAAELHTDGNGARCSALDYLYYITGFARCSVFDSNLHSRMLLGFTCCWD